MSSSFRSFFSSAAALHFVVHLFYSKMIHNEWTSEFMVIVCSLQVALHGYRTCIRLLLLTTDRLILEQDTNKRFCSRDDNVRGCTFFNYVLSLSKDKPPPFLSSSLPSTMPSSECTWDVSTTRSHVWSTGTEFIFYGLIFCRTSKHIAHSLWRVLCRAGGRVINQVNFSVTIRWRSQIATRIHHSPFDS